MKRINNLHERTCSIENLQLADSIARKGKAKQRGIIEHDKNREANILQLHRELVNKEYKTSEYRVFTIYEPKEREIFQLPYRDRIVHHAAMNIMESIWMRLFTADTYSCIKGKGIHAATKAVRKALKDQECTKYCLKLDIKKFYPSVDNAILKVIIGKKLKDKDQLQLLYGIIDSAVGLPIGNYLSQYFANVYLSYFDHWLKEVKKVKYYFRYCDDLVILADNKPVLHQLLSDIRTYLKDKLNLSVKSNYQVFPVDARSIDFVGYRFYHTHTLLRKTIKKSFARMLKERPNKASTASYLGWAKHADTRHLIKKLLSNDDQKV